MTQRQTSALRLVSQRISSTPPKQLPLLIPHITPHLAACKSLFSEPLAGNQKDSTGNQKDSTDGVLLHKFKTQITALLNDRTPEAHWAAAVLIKTTIDLGGWQMLQNCGPWVRGLLSILGKPGLSATKRVCIVTLTRIFLSMHGYPSLTREITTPSMPAFLTACLNLISPAPTTKPSSFKPSASLTSTVLDCLCKLLPNHPTIFRTVLPRLKETLCRFISPTLPEEPTSTFVSDDIVRKAQALYVLMHFSAPKSNSSVDWNKAMEDTLRAAHSTASRVLRAVIEDWEAQGDYEAEPEAATSFDPELKQTGKGPLDLPVWRGMYAGCARLKDTLKLLEEFTRGQTAAMVAFPLGNVADLLMRLFSVTVPSVQQQDNIRLNPQVSREEREALWAELPGIHAVALDLLATLAARLPASSALDAAFMGLLEWVFQHEQQDERLCLSAYTTVAIIIRRSGIAFSREQTHQLTSFVESCCTKLGLPSKKGPVPAPSTITPQGKPAAAKTTLNSDSFLDNKDSTSSAPTAPPIVLEAASAFLEAYLANAPAQHMPHRVRALLDRTIIWSGEREPMLASVLNPPQAKKGQKPQSSILPFLARAFPGDAGTEAILRPRMPLWSAVQGQTLESDDKDDDVLGESVIDAPTAADLEMSNDVAADRLIGDASQQTIPDVVNPSQISTKQGSSDAGSFHSDIQQQFMSSTATQSIPALDPPVQPEASLPETLVPRKRDAPVADEISSTSVKRARSDDISNDTVKSSMMIDLTNPIVSTSEPVSSVQARTELAPKIVRPDIVVESNDSDDDDDENFVIPQLTMEPDSDVEIDADDDAGA